MSIQIVSCNARGLGDPIKRRMLFNYYKKRGNIICFQETHSCEQYEKMWANETGNKIIYSHGQTNSKGVCIAFDKQLGYRVVQAKSDNNGRIVACELENKDDPRKRVTICNIYAPNQDKPNFFLEVIRMVADMSPNLIIIGDFNVVLDPNLDRHGSGYNNKKAQATLLEIMNDMSLIEIWRVRFPEEKIFSWMKPNPYAASRIDYALVAQGLSSNCVNTMYLPGIKTDHMAFFLAIEQICCDRGPGFWKLNNLNLEKPEFYDKVNKCIEKSKMESEHLNPVERWIFVKSKVVQVCKQYSKQTASERELIISQLSEKILQMEYDIANVKNPTTQQINILMNSKEEITQLLEEKTKGTMFRAKVNWTEYGERSSKMFFNLEKARYNARVCSTLLDTNGKEISEPKHICDMQRKFYQELYKSDDTVTFDMENTSGIFVPTEIIEKHNKQFSMEEFKIAVKQLKRNKTPRSKWPHS